MTRHGKHRPGYRRPATPLPPKPDLPALPSILGIAPRWLVVVGKPGKYRALQDALHKLGVPAWCPLAIRLRRHARSAHWIIEPLLAPYLFVGPRHDGDLALLRSQPLFGDFMPGDRGEPAMLPEAELEALRLRIEAEGGALPIGQPRHGPWSEGGYGGPKPGTKLRIISGLFAGAEALCSVAVRDRVTVLIDAVRLNLRLDQVEPV